MIFKFFLTIRNIVTHQCISLLAKEAVSFYILQPFSGFGICSSKSEQTWSVESFFVFARLREWLSIPEHVLIDCNIRPGETGQHCLPNTVVSVLNKGLPFCPWLMVKKQRIVFAKQC